MSNNDFNTELIGLSNSLEFFALSLTRNDEDAKDLLQETMVKAITYRDKFVEKTNLKAWCYTIMKNTFINNYRRAIKANALSVNKEKVTDHMHRIGTSDLLRDQFIMIENGKKNKFILKLAK